METDWEISNSTDSASKVMSAAGKYGVVQLPSLILREPSTKSVPSTQNHVKHAGMFLKYLERLLAHKLHKASGYFFQCIKNIKLLRHVMFPSR